MADETLWRYLSFSKYIDFLESRSLYFARASRFPDQTEGKWPAHARLVGSEQRVVLLHQCAGKLDRLLHDTDGRDDEIATGCRRLIEEIPAKQPPFWRLLLEDALGMDVQRQRGFLAGMAVTWRNAEWANGPRKEWWLKQVGVARESTYVSCWNRSVATSLAMWSMYCGGPEGVALRISRSALMRVLQDNASKLEALSLVGTVGDVAYLEGLQHPTDETMLLINRLSATPRLPQAGPFLVKPKMYEFEGEVRALLVPAANNPRDPVDPHPEIDAVRLDISPGQERNRALSEFILEVRVHPELDATSSQAEAVRALHAVFGATAVPVLVEAVKAFNE